MQNFEVKYTIRIYDPSLISELANQFKKEAEKDVYGTLHAGDKYTTVESGSYTNKAFGYTAPDGFPAFQYS